MITGSVHGNGGINGLQQGSGVYTGNEEAGFVQSLGTLSRSPDADCRERMADRCEEGGFLRQCSGIRYDRKCVHLETVVVVEAKRFMLYDSTVQFEARSLQTAAARITNVVCPMGKSSYSSGECMLSCLVRQRCKGKTKFRNPGKGIRICGIRDGLTISPRYNSGQSPIRVTGPNNDIVN